jgi:hypothetical protein
MWRAIRIVVMWLLAAAIPVQGFAAVTVHRCGAKHHDVVAHQHASHHHADATVSDPHEADDGVKHSSKGSCSLCASCCTGAALPATIVAFDAAAFVESLTAAAVGSVPAFLTDGPERPPRSILA